MHITGLKLSFLALATGELSAMANSFPDAWIKLGVGGMAVIGLIYIYNDMRKVHKEKELILRQNTAELQRVMTNHSCDLQKIMIAHKQDVQVIVQEQIQAAANIAKVASELVASNNEVLRDNIKIMEEVKDVIKANTAAAIWCRDSALARAKN